jgi:hypothetical protein
MSKPSQGLRALASMLETVTPELAPVAQTALAGAAASLHQAADAQAAAEAARLGPPAAGPALAAFATAMVDGFFALFQVRAAAKSA